MVTILDGGMGSELIRRGAATRGGLWAAQALIDAPEAVLQLHRDYIEAGARVVTTNSYSTVPSYLSKKGLGDRFVELTALAGELARRAVNESGESVQVAGSLPPLSESYRSDLVPADHEARPIYRQMAIALESFVDYYQCETMSSAREARNAATQALQVGASRKLPVYVSWTLEEEPGEGLRSGESVSQAYQQVCDLEIEAFLFNCTSPEAIEQGLLELRELTDKPIGAYPNRFDQVPKGWTLDNDLAIDRRADLSTELFVAATLRCIEAGATLVGGCCGIGPEDIQKLAEALGQS